jgi:hypothetical protein
MMRLCETGLSESGPAGTTESDYELWLHEEMHGVGSLRRRCPERLTGD